MSYEAISQVRGVKVIRGQNKGESVAMPGDIFDTKSAAEGDRLVACGAAKKIQSAQAKSATTATKKAAKRATANKSKVTDDEPGDIDAELGDELDAELDAD